MNGTAGERYEVGEVLGRGRSAVHRGLDRRLGRQVALKHVVLDDDDVRARTLREARATARLVTPHVVALYDVVEEPDAIWLVMELVEAPSLLRLVDERGPLDDAAAARVGLGVLAGLEAAHAAGIVHRDVKPANILVGADDDGEAVKLADFGVAAWRDDAGLTEPGMIIGSPSYMAPEQATAGPVGPAADLWGLGAALYFAREGEPPFAGTSAMAAAVAVVRDPPRPQLRPGPLSPLIEALLAKDPARRPSPTQVRSVLEAVARGAEPAHLPAAGAAAMETVPRGAEPAEPPAELRADHPSADVVTVAAAGAVAPAGPSRPRRRRTRPRALLAAAAAVAVAALGGAWFTGGGGEPPAGTQPAVADTTPAAPATAAGTDAPPGASAAGPTAGPDTAADGGEETTVDEPAPAPDAAAPAAVPAGSEGASGPGSSGSSSGSSGSSGGSSGPGSPATTAPPTTAPATTVPTTVPEDPGTTVPEVPGDGTTPTTDPDGP